MNMEKQRNFVCLANGQNTKVTVIVTVDDKIVERVEEVEGMRQAAELVKERYDHELLISECFESYEAYRKAMKERRTA